jgi:hypothetical protein
VVTACILPACTPQCLNQQIRFAHNDGDGGLCVRPAVGAYFAVCGRGGFIGGRNARINWKFTGPVYISSRVHDESFGR